MSSRFYVDADLKYFAKHLQNKPRGRAYLALYKKLVSLEEHIKIASKHTDGRLLEQIRRQYIGVTDLCTLAIGELERTEHWPP